MLKNKKTLLILTLSLASIVCIFAVLELTGVTDFYQKSSSNPDDSTLVEETDRFINLDPPTDEEKAAGDEIKNKIVEDQNLSAPSTAQVVIVDATQYDEIVEVRAFVSNLIADGTCTYTFTQEGVVISEETQAFADATTTPCLTLNMDRSEFPKPGTWKIDVTYSSTEASGSAETSLEIN